MILLAELNENNIVIGLKTVREVIDDGKHVEIESMNEDLLWRKFEGYEEKFVESGRFESDGTPIKDSISVPKWSEVKFLPSEEPQQPSIEEQILFESKYQTLLLEMGMMF